MFSDNNNLLVSFCASHPAGRCEHGLTWGQAEDHAEIFSAFCMLNIILRYSMNLFSTQKLRRFLLQRLEFGRQRKQPTEVMWRRASQALDTCREPYNCSKPGKTSISSETGRAPEGSLDKLCRINACRRPEEEGLLESGVMTLGKLPLGQLPV